ncbi:MAG: ATP-binding protein, partial [Ignavibacteriae bacterium]
MTSTHNENPFPITGKIPARLFCDREVELSQLKKACAGGANVTLISLRRMGKTVLIDQLFERLPKRSYTTYKIDALATQSLSDLCTIVAGAIARIEIARGRKALEGLMKLLSRVRASLTIDPNTQVPSIEFGIGAGNDPQYTLFELFSELDKQKTRVVFAIDEIQQIAHYPGELAEAHLRTVTSQMRNITFIFAGSDRTLMSSMFNDRARPFYHSTEIMTIDPIPRSVYAEFIVEQFTSTGRKISLDLAGQIYDLVRGHTFYVQAVCRRVWDQYTDAYVTMHDITQALYDITSQQVAEYHGYRNLMSSHQWKLFVAIGKDGAVVSPTGRDFIEQNRLGLGGTV